MSQITMKEAVVRAKTYIADLYTDDQLKALALEEIEQLDQGEKKLWAVTLGFQRRQEGGVATPSGIAFLQPSIKDMEHRVYKTVLIDAGTGDFVRMDMRQVQ